MITPYISDDLKQTMLMAIRQARYAIQNPGHPDNGGTYKLLGDWLEELEQYGEYKQPEKPSSKLIVLRQTPVGLAAYGPWEHLTEAQTDAARIWNNTSEWTVMVLQDPPPRSKK